MGMLYRFPQADSEEEILTPVLSRPGDEFLVVRIIDGGHKIFAEGTRVVVLRGVYREGRLHAIGTEFGAVFARLTTEGDQIRVASFHAEFTSGLYERQALAILGRAVESYPIKGELIRAVFWDETAEVIIYPRPLRKSKK
jgi:hypothetical protein